MSAAADSPSSSSSPSPSSLVVYPPELDDFPSSAAALDSPAVLTLLHSHFSHLYHYFSALTYNTNPLIPEYLPGVQRVKSPCHRWSSVLSTAKQLINLGKPIKCFEAVVLSIYFTESIAKVLKPRFDRWILRFQSLSLNAGDEKFDYWHAIMIIRADNKWGALGLSRRESLGRKPLVYDSSLDLISDFCSSYSALDHELQCLTLSQPAPIESTDAPFNWSPLVIRIPQQLFSALVLHHRNRSEAGNAQPNAHTPQTNQTPRASSSSSSSSSSLLFAHLSSVLSWFELNSSLLSSPGRPSLPDSLFYDSKTGKIRMKIPSTGATAGANQSQQKMTKGLKAGKDHTCLPITEPGKAKANGKSSAATENRKQQPLSIRAAEKQRPSVGAAASIIRPPMVKLVASTSRMTLSQEEKIRRSKSSV